MIVFLTLCYVGLLALLVKVNVIKLTLWWKISPVVWIALLLIVLFIPMQWGAPSGAVNVYQPVVEIVPNVSGEVIEMPIEGSKPLSRGDLLFKIDPTPFQAEVDRLEAALKEAEQQAKALPVELGAAKSQVAQAEAAVIEAQQQAAALESSLDAAKAAVTKFEAQLALSETEFTRASNLLKSNAAAQQDVDKAQRNLDASKATLDEAKAVREQAQLAFDSQIDGVNTLVIQAREALEVAVAAEAKAQLAVDSTINGVNTSVASLQAQLVKAKYDLEQTEVRAPSDGFVNGATLEVGQRVTQLPMRAWMAFVDTKRSKLAVGIDQYKLRHVRVGQEAEVVLKLYPGKTFRAKVEKMAYITPSGQLQPTGNVAMAPTAADPALPIAVLLELEDENLDVRDLPGGAVGTAAIYTESAAPTHVIRRVMLRMQTLLNYVLP